MAAESAAVNFIVVFSKKRNWNPKREMIFKELGVLSFSALLWETGGLFSHKKNCDEKNLFFNGCAMGALWKHCF